MTNMGRVSLTHPCRAGLPPPGYGARGGHFPPGPHPADYGGPPARRDERPNILEMSYEEYLAR